MDGAAGWILGAIALSLVLVGVSARSRSVQAWQVERLAARVGLPVPPALEADLRARTAARLLGSASGGLAGLALALGVTFATGSQHDRVGLYACAAVAVAGYGAGLVWASFLGAFQHDDRPRVARLDTVTLSAYVPSLLRLLAWVLWLATIALVAVELGGRDLRLAVVVAPLLAVSTLSLVALEVLGRRLVLRGQPAATTEELMWDDALRSSALNGVATGIRQVLLITLIGSTLLVTDTASAWLLLPAFVITAGSVVLVRMSRIADTWYLEQLWPGTPAGVAAQRGH
ncbi:MULTISPECIES: hypothetical protein [unclassified Curtobacterium]|uniref:hypothetical protein n=1 Tax=unclassified Curtobacterium TaxID=257496 RepID=UPI0008DD6445|nr:MULTISPECIES: hypothetical protein [unclassified Curtobacterium]OIH98056.1 hypothetical protein BIU92_14785 [Curtobacterium sp. MCBA15_003]OII32823.1 hypothetical protein BIU94_16090 [Curtobacterium sp. MMLR14_006]